MNSPALLNRNKLARQVCQQSPAPARLRSASQNSNQEKFTNTSNSNFQQKFAMMQQSGGRHVRSKQSLQAEEKNALSIEKLQKPRNSNNYAIRPTYTTFTKDSREQTDFDTRSPTFDNSTTCMKKLCGPQIGNLG